jgi:hypothetical protein
METNKQLAIMVESIIAGKSVEAKQAFRTYAIATLNSLVEGKKDKSDKKDEDESGKRDKSDKKDESGKRDKSDKKDKDESDKKGKRKLPKGFVPFQKKDKSDDE